MKEIKINDIVIELKKDYLTRAEGEGIITYAIQSFNNKGIIEGLSYDYLGLENAFFDALCLICVKDFDDEKRELIYNAGMKNILIDKIINAKDIYNEMHFIAKEFTSIGNTLSIFVENLFSKLPNEEMLDNLNAKMPELKSALEQYNKIINGSNQEGE